MEQNEIILNVVVLFTLDTIITTIILTIIILDTIPNYKTPMKKKNNKEQENILYKNQRKEKRIRRR